MVFLLISISLNITKSINMRKFKAILLLSFASLFLLMSCKKIDTPSDEAKALFGEWMYKFDSGGFSGSGGSNRFPSNCTVKFTEKGEFFMYEDGKKKDKKRFKIEMKPSISAAQSELAIVYSKGNYDIFRINGNQLILSDNHVDGFTYFFIRKN